LQPAPRSSRSSRFSFRPARTPRRCPRLRSPVGFPVGADRQLADYRQIASYFKTLAAASPRVQVQVLGKTTLGEDMFMAIISSEENIQNLKKLVLLGFRTQQRAQTHLSVSR
jgi:hypothetical protein